MAGDRNIKIDDGNYTERLRGDYLQAKVSSNTGAKTVIQKAKNLSIRIIEFFNTFKFLNTFIQKAGIVNVYIRGEGNSDTSNSNVSKSSVNIEQNQDKKYEMTFVFTGTLTAESKIEFNGKKIKITAIFKHLEKFCNGELTIEDISKGSVRVKLGGSPEDLEKLQELFNSGELNEVLGIPVQDVQLIATEIKEDEEKIETNKNSRLSEEIFSQDTEGQDLVDDNLILTNLNDSKPENKDNLYSQKGNFGIGHLSGGEIGGHALVAGTIVESQVHSNVEPPIIIQKPGIVNIYPRDMELSYALTDKGLEKAKKAIRKDEKDNNWDNPEQQAEIAGIRSTKTITEFWKCNPVNLNIINAFNETFGMQLIKGIDYIPINTDRGSKKRSKTNLPCPVNEFLGRKEELSRLLEVMSLRHRSPIITIHGIGGVGKTALVLKAAHLSYRASYFLESSSLNPPIFEAFIFVSAKRSILTPGGILDQLPGQFQKTLGDIYRIIANTLDDQTITRASGEKEQLDKVYQSLERQRTLLIIDNMETVNDEDEIMAFLSNLPDSTKAVITTRNWKGTFPCIYLDGLPEEDSLKLIEQQVEEKIRESNKLLQPLSKEHMKSLYDCFGGVPLALIYSVGRWAMGYSLQAILESSKKLSNGETKPLNNNFIMSLLAFIYSVGGWVMGYSSQVSSKQLPKDIVHFVFRDSLDLLRGKSAYKLLMSMGMFLSSPTKDALVKVAGFQSYFDVENDIVELIMLAFIYEKKDQQNLRYEILPLTRQFVLDELMNNKKFKEQAQKRLVSWYVKFAKENGGRDWEDWVFKHQNIESEFTDILAVIDWCIAHGHYQDFKKLCESLCHYASLHGYWKLRRSWLEILIKEAKKIGDWETAINAMSEYSYTLIMMGGESNLKEAEDCLLEALSKCSSNDFKNQLSLHKHMAILRIHQQRYEEAKQELNQVEELIKKMRFSHNNKIRAEISLAYYRAEIEFRIENYEQAKNLYLQVLGKAQEINWPRRRIDAQIRLNEIAIKQNSPDNLGEVQQSLIRILDEAESNQYKLGIANCQGALASLHSKVEEHDKACSWARMAIGEYERLGMNQQTEEMISLCKYCSISMIEENERVS